MRRGISHKTRKPRRSPLSNSRLNKASVIPPDLVSPETWADTVLSGCFVTCSSAHKNHISLHPTTPAIEEKIKELSKYKKGAGTLQFALDEPLPSPLICKVIKLLSKENRERTKKK